MDERERWRVTAQVRSTRSPTTRVGSGSRRTSRRCVNGWRRRRQPSLRRGQPGGDAGMTLLRRLDELDSLSLLWPINCFVR